MAAEQRQQN